MEIHDFKFEEFMISEPAGLWLHGFDFVVGSFQGTGGYWYGINQSHFGNKKGRAVASLAFHLKISG